MKELVFSLFVVASATSMVWWAATGTDPVVQIVTVARHLKASPLLTPFSLSSRHRIAAK